jgi:hypothetical protein
VGGPYSTLGIFADDTVAWGYYTVNYLVPNLGTNYSIRFNPIYGTGIIQGYGNFLDSVSVCATNVGMNEIAQNGNSVSVFPSLFTDELNVTYKGKESLQFILYDLSTRTVLNQFITGSTSLNTHQLAKGIYLYELRNENGLIKKEKVIKE